MRSIKWRCNRWPWVTLNPLKHPNFCIFRRILYLRSELTYLVNKICAPRKRWPKFTKIFRGCYSTKPLNQHKFHQNWFKKCLKYPQSKICVPRESGPKFAKNFWRMLLTKSRNCKILWPSLKKCPRYRDRRFVAPENVGQSSPKIFRLCYSKKPLTNLNFVKIG